MIDILQDGILYAYTSNESNWDAPVMLDNMMVSNTTVAPVVIDRQDYYAFGMTHQQLLPGQLKNRYLYNGKILTNDFGLGVYDYGVRQYDPSTGRFLAVDPLADEYASWSIYNYTLNNPIRLIDPDGAAPTDVSCCGGYQQVANDQVLATMYLQFVAAGRNLVSTTQGYLNSYSSSPFIVRREYTVAANDAGQPFIHESAPYITDKLTAGFFAALDGASLYPGGGPAGLLAKTPAKATLISSAKSTLKQFTREGDLGGTINLFEGNSKKGLRHILERHSADEFTEVMKGDLFPSGTTNEQIFDAIEKVYSKGTRVSDPEKAVQTFEKRIRINNESANYRLIVDRKAQEVVTFFRIGGNE